MYPEVSSKIYHDFFRQLGSSVSLPWVIYFEAFFLHVVSSFFCIPVKVAILPLDLPRSEPVTHSGEILNTDKSHGKKPAQLYKNFPHYLINGTIFDKGY